MATLLNAYPANDSTTGFILRATVSKPLVATSGGTVPAAAWRCRLAAVRCLILVCQTAVSSLYCKKLPTLARKRRNYAIKSTHSYVTMLNPNVRAYIFELGTLKLILLVSAALIAAVVEEVVFRGYALTEVHRMGYGPVVQVFVSGLAFSIAHLYAFASPAAMLLTMAYTFALAVALAILYIVGHRSLTAPIISHALINAVIQPALLLSLFTGPGV